MTVDFTTVTELSGDDVSQEQVDRMCHRYYWAGEHCRDKDVIEVACGNGQGLGYLASVARSLRAGDYSPANLAEARQHYQDRIVLLEFDAEQMPFEDGSADAVIIFEALYYLPNPEKFVAEARRVLRPGGKVLVATANKDLYDFNPSPYSRRYFGVVELGELLRSHGFESQCFGAWDVQHTSFRQHTLRNVKKIAVKLHLIPGTMRGKKLLKRLVFGKLVSMPAEVEEGMSPYKQPVAVPNEQPDRKHKVIYCEATLRSKE